jgi:cell division protein FtsI/penicillin-binding protein 2
MNPAAYRSPNRERSRHPQGSGQAFRDNAMLAGVIFVSLVIAIRLGQLQISQGAFYSSLAAGRGDVYAKLMPERGQIFVHERGTDSLYPVATDRDLWVVYSDNRKAKDTAKQASVLAPLLVGELDAEGKTPEELDAEAKRMLAEKEAEILKRLSVPTNQYAPLARGVPKAQAERVRALDYDNINFATEKARFYPETGMSGQLLGFVGYDGDEKAGRYGLEGYWNKELSGVQGRVGDGEAVEKEDGSDIVLTVDRALESFVCTKVKEAVKRHGAESGSAVMLDPKTGAVMAMCGSPDFDPNEYGKAKDHWVFNNQAIWAAYEPGSVMKAMTMAAALDSGAVLPNTTYTDTGEEKFGDKIVKNSDRKAHGLQTMIYALDNSLNTGAIFAMRKAGVDLFKSYLSAFGFGTRSGIELDTESAGNMASLKSRNDIDVASASFGQGITATVLQIATAYAAIANGGNLMRPYVVDEIVRPDGTKTKTQPRVVRQVVSSRASTLLSGMLVSVVKNGHGKRAGVPGYLVAGKTGTAQVAKSDGTGYDETATIGTFAGFAPVSDPRFALVVRIDKPRDVEYAESTAAPLFGEIAAFTLKYLEVQPDDTD